MAKVPLKSSNSTEQGAQQKATKSFEVAVKVCHSDQVHSLFHHCCSQVPANYFLDLVLSNASCQSCMALAAPACSVPEQMDFKQAQAQAQHSTRPFPWEGTLPPSGASGRFQHAQVQNLLKVPRKSFRADFTAHLK